MPARITAIVTTFNEIDQIDECLRSLSWTDELIVVDSYSTDGTVELIRDRFPRVRLEQRTYRGAAAQKNFAIDIARNDWILCVDADERVTPKLANEIEAALERTDAWAYSIGRRNFVLGKEVRYSGLQRDRVTRLFHRAHARYPNRRVHADLDVEGTAVPLQTKFLHNYVRSFDHMAAKMTRYGIWGAAQMFADGRRGGASKIVIHTAYRFIRDYFFNRGFLDGTRGLIVVGMHVYYTFWKYAKLWEYTQLQRNGETVKLPPADTTDDTWVQPWKQNAAS